MRHQKNDATYIVRLERGETLPESLQEFCLKEGIKSAYFTGIGAVQGITLSYYDLETKQYADRNFAGAYEVCSLHGNITTVSEQPFMHAHIVLSDNHMKTFGGHLQMTTVNVTLELVISVIDTPLTRIYDETVGLKLIDL